MHLAPAATDCLHSRGRRVSYPGPVLESVVNISEGRDDATIDAIGAAAGSALLDVHRDRDHHRSVFTLAAVDPATTERAVRALADAALRLLDVRNHSGVHPRLGVIDVVPFISFAPTPSEAAVAAARDFGDWLAANYDIPVFMYDQATADARTLPTIRRDAFESLGPDRGPSVPDPKWGATAVGARGPLIAVNVELETDDVTLARDIAHRVRERDGGIAGVRALGLALASRGTVQVSMNLVDLAATSMEGACTAVRDLSERADTAVRRIELVGMLPAHEITRSSVAFLEWSGLGERHTIEAHLPRP